jgi:hypothetical protein
MLYTLRANTKSVHVRALNVHNSLPNQFAIEFLSIDFNRNQRASIASALRSFGVRGNM